MGRINHDRHFNFALWTSRDIYHKLKENHPAVVAEAETVANQFGYTAQNLIYTRAFIMFACLVLGEDPKDYIYSPE